MNASVSTTRSNDDRTGDHAPRAALAAGGLAALLASTCCLGPLVLVMLGVSGAWIGNLTALEPFRPLFVAAALVALALAWRRIYRPATACKPGEVCAVPQMRRGYRVLFWVVAALAAVAIAFPYVLPLFY
jgi:mercuric ion transport protein